MSWCNETGEAGALVRVREHLGAWRIPWEEPQAPNGGGFLDVRAAVGGQSELTFPRVSSVAVFFCLSASPIWICKRLLTK